MSHLKRLFTPRSWNISLWKGKFITRPRGPHKMEISIPMTQLLKDIGVSRTTREGRIILHNHEIKVNGRRVKDRKFGVGLFDLVDLPQKKRFRILLDKKGRLTARESKDKLLPLKVINKKVLSGGKIQINLTHGFNLSLDEKIRIRDSVMYDIDSKRAVSVAALEKGAPIYFSKGKYAGRSGVVKEIIKNKITFTDKKGGDLETLKDYAVVIGKKKEEISL